MTTNEKLPKGHEDEKSYFWIRSDLREFYPRESDTIEPLRARCAEEYLEREIVDRHAGHQSGARPHPYQDFAEEVVDVTWRRRGVHIDRQNQRLMEDRRKAVAAIISGGRDTIVPLLTHYLLVDQALGRQQQRAEQIANQERVEQHETCSICGVAAPRSEDPTGPVRHHHIAAPGQWFQRMADESELLCGACADTASRLLAAELDKATVRDGRRTRVDAVREALVRRGRL